MAQPHGCFVWYELMTTDMDAARTFYAGVLGWGTQDASMPGLAYQLLSAEDTPVAGLLSLPDEARRAGVAPHWAGYVGVDDVDIAAVRVKTLGGTVYVPPTDVADISRFSVFADPQGATLSLLKWRKPAEAAPAAPIALGRVGWHELLAADGEKAFAFYAALFGWQKTEALQGVMGIYQQFAVAGEMIGGMFTKPPTLPLPFWLYYFNVADIEAAAQRVEAGGGEIIYGPMEVPGGASILHCADPQGAVFALLDRHVRKPIGYVVPAYPDRRK
jgi:uncharacterized protein